MSKTIIETENMCYTYPDGTSALQDINIEIKKGERAAIIGSNGAGKSTLFLHFNGILKPTSGLIKIDGEPLNYKKNGLLRTRQKVGIVFQNPDDQLFAPTVEEDVAFGPINLGIPIEEVDKRVKESLEMVGMSGLEKKPPHHLSGGQKKRVAIAGILAMKPEIMVMDEPTTGLDPQGAKQIMSLLFQLNRDDMSIIISSHDVEMITQFADKIFVLHEGEFIGQGSPEEIFNNPQLVEKANLVLPKSAALLHLLKGSGFSCDIKLTVDEAYHEILHTLGIDTYHNLLHLVKNKYHHQLLHEIGEENYHKLLHVLKDEKIMDNIPPVSYLQ
ncbi:MAG: ATP-binding cassette domain-containing protein [Methanobacterium sp.]